MTSPYRLNSNKQVNFAELEQLEEQRLQRIKKLFNALNELYEHKTEILADLKRYPVEITIGDHYRVVLAESDEFEQFMDRIEQEIFRLTNPQEIMWEHMNLLSGLTSGKPSPIAEVKTRTRTILSRLLHIFK